MNVIKWGLYECGLANAHWHIDAGAKIRLLEQKQKQNNSRAFAINNL